MIVTVEDYRLFTGDCSTTDSDVEAKLQLGQGLVEEECDRIFDYGTYTEVLPTWRSTRLYPRAVPIADPGVTGSDIQRFDDYTLSSRVEFDLITTDVGDWVGLMDAWDGSWAPVGALVLFPSSPYTPGRYTTVTYSGGFKVVGGTLGATAPVGLRMCIAQVAFALGSSGGSSVGPGVIQAQVGDVNVRWVDGSKVGSIDELVPGMSRRLRRYRRPVY